MFAVQTCVGVLSDDDGGLRELRTYPGIQVRLYSTEVQTMIT